MVAIKVHNLVKQFKDFVAVDHISFELKEGEILGLLGPNGAGKTTTIQMLLGVLSPTSGDISYFGKSLQDNREAILEKVNFSSTYTNLPWKLSVKENLTYISYLYDIADRKKRVSDLVEIFRLSELLNLELNELSAGQLTRVNLAKAFINKPNVLLLDEPTASLDPEIAAYVREFILEERKKHNISIIFTSHNMPEVEEICDRVLFINHGKIIADNTPENLAKSIEFCKLQLMMKKDTKEVLTRLCEEENLLFSNDKRFTNIQIKETYIPTFLQKLMAQGGVFEEISIEKPNLEDFFLQASRSKDKNISFDEII